MNDKTNCFWDFIVCVSLCRLAGTTLSFLHSLSVTAYQWVFFAFSRETKVLRFGKCGQWELQLCHCPWPSVVHATCNCHVAHVVMCSFYCVSMCVCMIEDFRVTLGNLTFNMKNLVSCLKYLLSRNSIRLYNYFFRSISEKTWTEIICNVTKLFHLGSFFSICPVKDSWTGSGEVVSCVVLIDVEFYTTEKFTVHEEFHKFKFKVHVEEITQPQLSPL